MYSYSEIVNELLKEFPEISGRYAGELAWIQDTFQGQETKGQTICFDRCFCDHIGRLLVSGHRDNVKIKQVFAFLEDMAASEDQEVKDLLQVTVLNISEAGICYRGNLRSSCSQKQGKIHSA